MLGLNLLDSGDNAELVFTHKTKEGRIVKLHERLPEEPIPETEDNLFTDFTSIIGDISIRISQRPIEGVSTIVVVCTINGQHRLNLYKDGTGWHR